MASCEKCWDDAGMRSRFNGKSKIECYNEILEERKDTPCSPKEQAGQFWDEKTQSDSRNKKQKDPYKGEEVPIEAYEDEPPF